MVKISCGGVIFPKIKAILFDKDGTLEDSREYLLQLTKERVQQIVSIAPDVSSILSLSFGIKEDMLDAEGLMAVGSRQENELGAAAIVASCGYGWYEAKEIVKEAFIKAHYKVAPNQTNSPLFADARKTIQALAKNKVKLGIVSADSLSQIEDFVCREDLKDYFQVLLGSDARLSKPDPLLYSKACRILGIEPNYTLMVGDSVGDITMAEEAGAMGTVGICWHSLSRSPNLHRATVRIANLQEIEVIS